MANLFVRTYTFVDGTTAYGSQVEAEIGNIVTVLNNLNTAATNWGQVSALHATSVPLISDCAAGSQHIADFKNNSVIKASIDSSGNLTAVGGTFSAAVAMGSSKITGLANGTASTDAAAFGQVHYMQAPVQSTETTGASATTGSFVDAGPSATITPSSVSSKIKITITGICQAATVATVGYMGISRAGSDLFTTTTTPWIFAPQTGSCISTFTMAYIDSPATTSATTYKMRIARSGANFFIGGTAITGSNTVIILEEVL